jgi:hypothetical protein
LFMYNNAFVNYSVSANHDYQDVYMDNYYSSPLKYQVSSSVVHKLHVRTMDVEANVRMETGYKYSTAVVISCMLASLKNIDDGYIYSLAVKQVETQMGFEVDRWIPAKVGGITEIEYQHAENTIFHIEVFGRISEKIHQPTLELIKTDLMWDVTMRLSYYSGVHPGSIEITIDQDAIESSTAMQHAINVLWSKAYETMPMLAPDLSFMRYTEGMLNGAKYHNGGFVAAPPKPVSLSQNELASMKQAVYGGKDERVDQLPGLKEMVTHPISKNRNTLERVIISLNDQHKWTREQIADWLDTLDIDLTFRVEVEDEQD